MLTVDRPFSAVRRVLHEATGVWFTGAAARVEYRGRPVFEEAYGVTRLDGDPCAIYVDTPFDLASLTKIFVSTLALRAVECAMLPLDDSLAAWMPEWQRRPHERITLRMLLAHTSGMNSGADYRQLLSENVARYALERELVAAPGERVIYSDLGFIALGVLLERAYGCSLAELMRAMRPSPAFRPRAGLRDRIPATEEDAWRGRVQGFVHDEKSFLMGGISGHAGLFGTAEDAAWIAEQYLAPLHGRAAAVLGAPLAAEAIREQAPDAVLRRGLGWALKTRDDNSCGRWFSPQTFGHTGFVGTCIWADPVRDCSGVLLTNSVYFGRNDTRDLRAAFYEALIEDLQLR
ncbi:MAG TPA: serine hydrolase [Candidatus Baltobacteraceae bacterium]|nr:serine hydrolase [Candidatus Baltobacteraceae bacterium]